jgi:hypothetical protein
VNSFDFPGEKLQGFGVKSAEILQFYFWGGTDETEGETAGEWGGRTVSCEAEKHHQLAA